MANPPILDVGRSTDLVVRSWIIILSTTEFAGSTKSIQQKKILGNFK